MLCSVLAPRLSRQPARDVITSNSQIFQRSSGFLVSKVGFRPSFSQTKRSESKPFLLAAALVPLSGPKPTHLMGLVLLGGHAEEQRHNEH